LHLNLYGGGFLAFIAVFPYIATKINDTLNIIPNASGRLDFIIS
jgi:hypothetical protein